MASRPPQTTELKPDAAIGAPVHKGFAATWNWVLSWVKGFKAGKGCKLSGAADGHPVLDVLIEGGAGISVSQTSSAGPYVVSLDGSDSDGGSHMGNASGSVAATGDVAFASASDACVEVLTAADGSITVGVYYT